MQLAVAADDVLAAVRQEKRHEQVVGVDAVGCHLEAQTVDLALALLAQAVLHLLEEIEVGVPRLRDVLDLEARLLDQRSPDVAGDDGGPHGHTVLADLLGHVVVALAGDDGGLAELALLALHHVADVDPAVLPGVDLQDLARIVGHHVGYDAAGQRRDDLLPLGREGCDAQLDLVAALLLVLGHGLAQRRVLVLDESLREPHARSRCRRPGDVRDREGIRRGDRGRSAQQRAPA